MFICEKNVSPLLERDVAAQFVCQIDQYDKESFNINECGFIRNDISKLARAQSQSEYDAIMKKLGQIEPKYNISDDMSIQDALNSVRPRNMQSACEIAYYTEYLTKMADVNKSYDSVKVPDSSLKVRSDAPADATVDAPAS